MISRLVMISLMISLVNCTFKKCCDSDAGISKIINSTKYNCSSYFEQYVLPLKYEINDTIIGWPKLCTEFCIDKTVEGTDVIKLSCENEKISSVNLPSIYKCCPLNMIYDINSKACVNDTLTNLIYDSSASVYNFHIGVPNCSWAIVDYTFPDNFEINNGTVTINNTNIHDFENEYSEQKIKPVRKIFENGTYCVDRSTQADKIHIRSCDHISLCNTELICVQKCCPPGYKFVKPYPKIKSKCVPDFSRPFYQNFVNSSREIVGIPEKLGILPKRECEGYAETKFSIYENGTLNYKDVFLHAKDLPYCVEYFEGPYAHLYIAKICFPYDPHDDYLHNFLYFIGLLISILFLAITITIYFFLPELQNLHGRTLMSHSTALMASYIFLAVVKKPTTRYDNTTCTILAYAIMYCFLVAFAWLNVMCFDIWFTFGVVKIRGIKKKEDLKKFLLYSLYAYGVPIIITGVTLYIDLFTNIPENWKPNFANGYCWFSSNVKHSKWPRFIYFTIPVAIILIINTVFFTLTVRHCLKVRADIHRMQNVDTPNKRRFFTDKATLIMNLKLFVVMGVSWIFELVSTYLGTNLWLWVALDTLNVLQGLWIFFIFVLKDTVWKAIRKKLGYSVVREGSQTQSTSLSTKLSVTSTTSLAKVNGISKPEEKELLHIAIRNSFDTNNTKEVKNTTV